MLHPVNEYELSRYIPAHEENGDEVFSGRLSACDELSRAEADAISNSYGMDPLASRFREAGRTAEGEVYPPFSGGHHPSVTVLITSPPQY